MPSGSRLPSLTITFRSDPSGFAENTWPLLALRKNKRAVLAFGVFFLISHLAELTAMIFFLPLFITSGFGKTGRIGNRSCLPLHEGAEPGYGFTQNQVLYLEGALIGVERFRIRKKATNVVVCDDAITAQKFPRPCDRLATLGGRERFG